MKKYKQILQKCGRFVGVKVGVETLPTNLRCVYVSRICLLNLLLAFIVPQISTFK